MPKKGYIHTKEHNQKISDTKSKNGTLELALKIWETRRKNGTDHKTQTSAGALKAWETRRKNGTDKWKSSNEEKKNERSCEDK